MTFSTCIILAAFHLLISWNFVYSATGKGNGKGLDSTYEVSKFASSDVTLKDECLSFKTYEVLVHRLCSNETISKGRHSCGNEKSDKDNVGAENCWSTEKRLSSIISGAPSSLEEYPYNVKISVNRKLCCAGSILSSRWILTAAHIFNKEKGNLATEVFIVHDENAIDVSRYFIHPKYKLCPNSRENDIALMELCDPIDMTLPRMKPICFSNEEPSFSTNQVMATAWYKAVFLPSKDILRENALNVISHDECNLLLNRKGMMPPADKDTFFCTYSSEEYTCLYDDGGPVVSEFSPGNWSQLGVISYGFPCDKNDTPRVHTKVTAFKDWIRETTKEPAPVFESEVNQTCPSGSNSSNTNLFSGPRNHTNSRCPTKTLFGENCWSGDEGSFRIVGGANATREYPYQIAIYQNGAFRCGGSIIAPSWILTAAHCVVHNNGSWLNVSIRYNSADRAKGKEAHVKKIIIHPNYTSRSYPLAHIANDIALLELCEPLDMNLDGVQPVCFAEEDTGDNGTVIATGWGTQASGGKGIEILQEVLLDIHDTEECEELYSQDLKISLPPTKGTYVCAFTEGKDTCQGDSGGPIVTEISPGCWIQLGITSYGKGCAESELPGIYTRVSAFKDWICEHTQLC